VADKGVNLKGFIRDIPDFPKKGILFRDITPLLADWAALAEAVIELAGPYKRARIDYVAAVEARGFIFGSAVARELNCGFVPLRKKGKLPYETESVSYALEYGTDTIEVHRDAVKPGDRVLMVDDLLATGGTMKAACELVEKLGAEIAGLTFLIELADLGGQARLEGYPIHVIMTY
jgi:adenine phosphoribosyltransferase